MAERGWAVDREGATRAVSCVAAPIFGPPQEIVPALSITGPGAAIRAEMAGPAVRITAAAASRAYSVRR